LDREEDVMPTPLNHTDDPVANPSKRGWNARKVGWPLAALGAILVVGYLVISQFGLS
jgi:hypothetical protein